MNAIWVSLPPNSCAARSYPPHKLDRLRNAGILQRCSGDNCHLRKFIPVNLDCPPLCRLSCHQPSSREVYPKSGESKFGPRSRRPGPESMKCHSRCESTGQRKDTR